MTCRTAPQAPWKMAMAPWQISHIVYSKYIFYWHMYVYTIHTILIYIYTLYWYIYVYIYIYIWITEHDIPTTSHVTLRQHIAWASWSWLPPSPCGNSRSPGPTMRHKQCTACWGVWLVCEGYLRIMAYCGYSICLLKDVKSYVHEKWHDT